MQQQQQKSQYLTLWMDKYLASKEFLKNFMLLASDNDLKFIFNNQYYLIYKN